MGDRMVVRSYRRVFRVDRRIYRVDRWALPVPGGVPLRGFGYFALALVAVLVVQALPVVGGVIGGGVGAGAVSGAATRCGGADGAGGARWSVGARVRGRVAG